jgi:hypothetical protein
MTMTTNTLHCYKMTWDTGFAPNPCFDKLTLATCKPIIRRCSTAGEWIAGLTAVTVHDKDKQKHDFHSQQKLLYLARITKVVPLEVYWEEYPEKRPVLVSGKSCGGCHGIPQNANDARYNGGDNIYEKQANGKWVQHPNGDHFGPDKEHDLSGKNALVCEEFYYFGVHQPLDVSSVFPTVNARQKNFSLDATIVKALISFVKDNANKAKYTSSK